MQIYLVGGAVRDALLGLAVKDRDWVVVRATPQEMLAQGFVAVGKDFPVFLHPQTHEEYALARTERKTAPGYHGFCFHAAPDVTLEEDLSRRDLTINAIAVNADYISATSQLGTQFSEAATRPVVAQTGAVPQGAKPRGAPNDVGLLVDPFKGRQDLTNKVFRHVSPAFAEDPVRILRVARLAARFADFAVAPATLQLMQSMVRGGEVDHLVAERVWQELAKGLMETTPSRMLEVLRSCGALARLLPEVDRLWGVPQRADYHPEIDVGAHLLLVLDMAAQLGAELPVRLACLTHDLGKGNTPADILPRHLGHEQRSVQLLKGMAERLRLPVECRELADVVAREHSNIHRSGDFDADAVVRLLERCDAFRKPDRFEQILLACECDARGRLGLAQAAYPQRNRLLAALAAALGIATKSIACQAMVTGAKGEKVGQIMHLARVAAVRASW